MSQKLLLFLLVVLLAISLTDLIPVFIPRFDPTYRQLERIEEQLDLLEEQIEFKSTELNGLENALSDQSDVNELHTKSTNNLMQLRIDHERAKSTLKELQDEHADHTRIKIWKHILHPILLTFSLVILARMKNV